MCFCDPDENKIKSHSALLALLIQLAHQRPSIALIYSWFIVLVKLKEICKRFAKASESSEIMLVNELSVDIPQD